MLPRKPRAVIFDMDGLLFDTERVFFKIITEASPAHGRAADEALFHSMIGGTSAVNGQKLRDFFGEGFDQAAFYADIRTRVAAAFENGVPLKPGVLELLDHLDALGPYAIATSSGRSEVARNLSVNDLTARFTTIVARGDYVNGKPHPEPYLKAAALLAMDPRDCLALEDSHNGVRAAHAAGTMAAMVPDILEATADIRALCVAVFDSLHDVRAHL